MNPKLTGKILSVAYAGSTLENYLIAFGKTTIRVGRSDLIWSK